MAYSAGIGEGSSRMSSRDEWQMEVRINLSFKELKKRGKRSEKGIAHMIEDGEQTTAFLM